jgi:hypothetical protein
MDEHTLAASFGRLLRNIKADGKEVAAHWEQPLRNIAAKHVRLVAMIKRTMILGFRPEVERTISVIEPDPGLARTTSSAPLAATDVQPATFSISANHSALVRSLHLDDPWLVALLTTAFLLRLVFWVYTGRTWEDALITVLHSENFYHGLGLTHFKIDDPRPLHGFTSPISVLVPLLADRFHVGWGLPFQKLVSLVAGPVAVWFGYRILQDYLAPFSRAAAVLGAGYLAIEHQQILWGMAGMETQIATAILLASMYFLFSGNLRASAIMAGLCPLARPDFILWTAIATVATAYTSYRRKDFKPLLTFVVIVSVVYGPWLIFTTLYYGSPIPNTIVAKSLGYFGFWESASSPGELLAVAVWVFLLRISLPLEPVFGGNATGFIPLVQGFWLAALCLAVIAIGLVFEAVRRRWRFWPVYAFAFLFAAFLTFRAPIVFEWYAAPLCAVFALLLAKGIADVTGLLPKGAGTPVAWLLTGAYLAAFAAVLPTTIRAERNIQELVNNRVRKAIGIYLSQTPPDTTIAGEPLGYIGYYSRRTYYDYPGLCSRKVVRWLQEHKNQRTRNQALQVFAYLRPDYLVLRRSEYQSGVRLPGGDFLLTDYHFDREFFVPSEDQVKLFHPEMNLDLDFLVLARNKDFPH